MPTCFVIISYYMVVNGYKINITLLNYTTDKKGYSLTRNDDQSYNKFVEQT